MIEGVLDASGGAGGFGGQNASLAGGGGGGGQIAVYAESITVLGTVAVDGGPCGMLTLSSNQTAIVALATVILASPYALDPPRLAFVAETYLTQLTPDVYSVNSTLILAERLNNSLIVEFQTEMVFIAESNMSVIASSLSQKRSYVVADVSVLDSSVDAVFFANRTSVSQTFTNCSNVGNAGTIAYRNRMRSGMRIQSTSGAENTSFALYLASNDTIISASNASEEIPSTWNGPVIGFQPSQPTRFTYYTKTDSIPELSSQAGFGSLVSLINFCEGCNNSTSTIGVYFGERFMYGNNFQFNVDDQTYLKDMITIDYYSELDQWYKVDIHIDWDSQQYYILLNDDLVTNNVSFTGEYVNGIRFSTFLTTQVWFDEIYVGVDPTMRFICPVSSSSQVNIKGSLQYNWKANEVYQPGSNGLPQYDPMSRHYSFYLPQNTLPFDGQGNLNFYQDGQYRYSAANVPPNTPQLHAGALLYLSNTPRSARTPSTNSATTASPAGWWTTGSAQAMYGRQFWYIEYGFASNLSKSLNGGICACSSQDLINWRFEGIVFHYSNISDMVYGTPGPFVMQKPKVLQNNRSNDFVLWAIMDNSNRSLAMAVTLSSPFEDGPFYFRRSLYPDGNQTRDQVTSWDASGLAMLSRTYYQTADYVLPEAMMQPVWESVKLQNGATNFRNSYHRTNYEIGYDNYHDIFLQRWRKEDKPWEVLCVNKITGVNRSIPLGTYNADGSICNDPEEYKIVIGQGDPYVQSNYVDPRDPANSWWRQTSVPAVQAQPWSNNVMDGLCGLQQYNEGIDEYDPNLVDFTPTDRSNCSNIADNPLNPSIPDKLIGIQRVVFQIRSKYVAASRLTDDLLDTTGWLSSIEGELQSADLISLVNGMSDFGLSPGEEIQTTFQPPTLSEHETALDYKIRFRQFIRQYNDRAYYSLACVIDGVCPVNYKDQLNL